MPELFLELFSEEIPARMQRRAATDLKRLLAEKLAGKGRGHGMRERPVSVIPAQAGISRRCGIAGSYLWKGRCRQVVPEIPDRAAGGDLSGMTARGAGHA